MIEKKTDFICKGRFHNRLFQESLECDHAFYEIGFKGGSSMAYVITIACMTEKATDCMSVWPVDCTKEGGESVLHQS